jgi:hypothetical protein
LADAAFFTKAFTTGYATRRRRLAINARPATIAKPTLAGSGTTNETSSTKTVPVFVGPSPPNVWIA